MKRTFTVLLLLFFICMANYSMANESLENNVVYMKNLITGEITEINLNDYMDDLENVSNQPYNPKEILERGHFLNDGIIYHPYEIIPGGSNLITAIVGTDDRYYSDITQFPYKCIGFFGIDYGNGNGTAFLVDDNIAVIAAHCVVGHDNFFFYPGSTNPTHPYGEAEVTAYIWAGEENYTGDGDYEDDWAVLILDTNVGNNAGWFGVSNLAEIPNGPSSWVGLNARTAGYPFDANLNQMASEGNILTATDKVMTHNVDVRRGNSGGPIFRYSGDYYAYAVATGEEENTDYLSYTYNYATRFSSLAYYAIMYGKANY